MTDWTPPGEGWIEGDAPRTLDYEEITYRRPLLGTLHVWHRKVERTEFQRQVDVAQMMSDSLVPDDE